MISVRTKICTENCKKAVKSSVSDFAAYVSEILGHFHLCLTLLFYVFRHFYFGNFVIFVLCFSTWVVVDNSLPLPVKPTDSCGI